MSSAFHSYSRQCPDTTDLDAVQADLEGDSLIIGPTESAFEDTLLRRKDISVGAQVVSFTYMYSMDSLDPGDYGGKGAKKHLYFRPIKAGMIQIVCYLACPLDLHGIRINSFLPKACPKPQAEVDTLEFIARLNAEVPGGRIRSAEEVALPVYFIMLSAANYVTGANVAVDGNWTAW